MPAIVSRSESTHSSKSLSGAGVSLDGVAVRYEVLLNEHRTLRGRLARLVGAGGQSAAFWALRDVSLEIRPGDVLGLVGRNGSGKSTLLRVLSRIIQPTEGSVKIVGSVSPMIELGSALNYDLTGRENSYLFGAIYKKSRSEMDSFIPEVLSFSELGPFFDAPVKSYSSGMIARLAFALGTQLRPDILLIDEVLSVGDEQFQKRSFFRIKKLIEGGSVVVLVSHSSSMIEQICNRAVLLSQGRVVSDGKPKQIIAEYQKLSKTI